MKDLYVYGKSNQKQKGSHAKWSPIVAVVAFRVWLCVTYVESDVKDLMVNCKLRIDIFTQAFFAHIFDDDEIQQIEANHSNGCRFNLSKAAPIEETSLCAIHNDLPLRRYKRPEYNKRPLQSSGMLDECGARAGRFLCATKLNAFILSENKWRENQSFPDESMRVRACWWWFVIYCWLFFSLRRNGLAFIGFIFLIGLFGNQFSFDCVFIASTVAREPPSRTMNFAIAKGTNRGAGKYCIFECTRWIDLRARPDDTRTTPLMALVDASPCRCACKRMPFPSLGHTNRDTQKKH